MREIPELKSPGLPMEAYLNILENLQALIFPFSLSKITNERSQSVSHISETHTKK